MLKRILATDNDVTGLVLRLTLGLVMFPHGAQKALGLFGGYGFSGTMGFFTEQMHVLPRQRGSETAEVGEGSRVVIMAQQAFLSRCPEFESVLR